MGNENDTDTDSDLEDNDDGDKYFRHQSLRPVPPPEAFQHVDELNRDQSNENNDNCNDKGDSEQQNRCETTVALASTMTAMSAPQRPSLLIRRQSSLFEKLPVRSKSLLFDDIVINNNNHNNKNNNINAIGNNIVAETMMTSATNFSRSQSTWLQEDHQPTLLEGTSPTRFSNDSKSQSRLENSKPQEQEGKSSLFGAVMRQLSSSISSALPAPPSSPFGSGRRMSSGVAETSPQKQNSGSGGGAGGFRDLMASPSGKTIMNIVNQFNSPFKFQSPSSSHKKRQRRRRLWGDDNDDNHNDIAGDGKDGEADAFATPKKRRRRQMDEDDENSKPSSNILFPDHDDNDSRSSLGGGLVDEHWREAPIIDTHDKIGIRMEALDWSLVTNVRIEVHDGTSRQRPARPIADTWIRDAMRDNEEALTYWIYQTPIVIDGAIGTPQSSGLLVQNNSSSNLPVLQKSVGTTKISMSRQGSFSSRFDTKLQNGKRKSNNEKKGKNDPSRSTKSLAKYLIQSVRGPSAKYSRKCVLEESSWWDQQNVSTSTTPHEDIRVRFQRQWQQALRSLFSNFRHRVLRNNNPRDSLNAMVLDTYFYCIGQTNSVLFRITTGSDMESDGNVNSNKDKAVPVPVVYVSSTSDAFRKQLESNGMDLNHNSEGDESFQLLESIQEREARERKKIAVATAAAVKKNKRIFNNVLLSPSVRADLEALRRAQAFGESAGADVLVKVKNMAAGSEEDQKGSEKLPKAIRVSGWDNVSLFLEVYLNLVGDTMGTGDEAANENGASVAPLLFHTSKPNNQSLPLLVCPNAIGFGPFEHASLKRLRLFPAKRIPTADYETEKKKSKEESNTNHGNAIEICGILLPCTIRKLLLVIRNRILEDEKITSATNSSPASSVAKRMASKTQAKNDDSDSSRYVVLHITRPKMANNRNEHSKSWIGGLNGSTIFNQGKRKETEPKDTNKNSDNGETQIFECPYGKVVSMAVWDASREEVAACKLDGAFQDNWFNRK